MEAVESAFRALGDYLRLVCLTDIAESVSVGVPAVAVPDLPDVVDTQP